MNEIKTIIIDDESLNRDVISRMIISLDEKIKIIGTAGNIETAYELINNLNPDVIFLDIKMPGGNGFELLQRFNKCNFEVVLVTGFDEYAIKAFEFNALDYVLKPIDLDKLDKTLKKICSRLNEKKVLDFNFKDIIDSYSIENNIISKIPIHINNSVFLLNVCDIVSLFSYEGYTKFKTINKEEFVSSKQFNLFDFIFDKNQNFCKINKGVYVNINYVKSYSKGQLCELTMCDDTVYEISRRKKTEFLSILALK